MLRCALVDDHSTVADVERHQILTNHQRALVSLLVSATTSRRWPQCPETPTRWRSGGIRTLDPARDDVALNVVRNGSEVADFKSVQYPAPVRNSGKVGKTHSVCSVGDHNLGVFTIAEIAVKIANAVPPTHLVSVAPNAGYDDLRRRRPSGTPLTCFARLARGQSLSTGHLANFRTLSSNINGE